MIKLNNDSSGKIRVKYTEEKEGKEWVCRNTGKEQKRGQKAVPGEFPFIFKMKAKPTKTLDRSPMHLDKRRYVQEAVTLAILVQSF